MCTREFVTKSGRDKAIHTNPPPSIKPTPAIVNKYLNGNPPIINNIPHIPANINAVEPLEGKINPTITIIGKNNGTAVFFHVYSLSLFFVK